MKRSTFLRLALAAAASPALSRSAVANLGKPRKLVLIAGQPSHPPMMHEFRAGTILLEKRLREVAGLVVDRHEMGWVTDESTFDDADAVVCFSDGNAKHPALQAEGRLALIESLVARGVGFGCMHFGVEVPKEIEGVKFTPLLVTTPTDETRDGPYVYPKGPYPHIQSAKGRKEALMWSVERPDGGRGFGFTGGHFHKSWQDEAFRKVILNALCWIAGVEVPDGGIASVPVSDEEIALNLDDKTPKKAAG
jgi:hypothetical protein